MKKVFSPSQDMQARKKEKLPNLPKLTNQNTPASER
jgi:hypothetical protein